MSNLKVAAAVIFSTLCLGGCATQDYVDKHTASVEGQVTGLQGQVREHDNHLAQLDRNAREALDRAEAAGKLAQGKFTYSVVLSDDSAHFPPHGVALSEEAKVRLVDFAAHVKSENKNVYLEIQGYTDAREAPGRNLQLGAERAEAVRRFLSQQGVALSRMSTISYGQDDPVAPNTTRAGRAQNRRVVIIVLE